jgi:hypothetical protein
VQLAEPAGESLPSSTDATRHSDMLRLLHAAADTCVRQGERLALVIDGLDEDSGAITGPNAHSIAALLPSRLPAGLRVIVSGRPRPPLPSDVPDDHPLRDPGTVRRLEPSPRAQVIRNEAIRELDRLLRGSPVQLDLLGLITAAGGGLSSADLAELSGRPAAEVQDCLTTFARRSFSSRRGQWQDEAVYILAHRSIRTSAPTSTRYARFPACPIPLRESVHDPRAGRVHPSARPSEVIPRARSRSLEVVDLHVG